MYCINIKANIWQTNLIEKRISIRKYVFSVKRFRTTTFHRHHLSFNRVFMLNMLNILALIKLTGRVLIFVFANPGINESCLVMFVSLNVLRSTELCVFCKNHINNKILNAYMFIYKLYMCKSNLPILANLINTCKLSFRTACKLGRLGGLIRLLGSN